MTRGHVHLLVEASLNAYGTSKYTAGAAAVVAIARRLLLVIVDKGFCLAGLMWPLQHQQACKTGPSLLLSWDGAPSPVKSMASHARYCPY